MVHKKAGIALKDRP